MGKLDIDKMEQAFLAEFTRRWAFAKHELASVAEANGKAKFIVCLEIPPGGGGKFYVQGSLDTSFQNEEGKVA